jgi:UDP-glucose 4-epimerase
MSKILVTGGLGFIGSHTVVELIKNNREVIIVDNLSNSSTEVLEGIEKISGKKPTFYKLELIDQLEVMRFFESQKDIKGIIHFAAYKAVGESVEDPIKYYENNLCSLINILKAISKYNINFIFSSSCTVYGQADNLPVTENTPSKAAESPYGNTKQICEEILMDYTNANKNISVISLRYFNPIGAHPSLNIGELPLGKPQNLIPFITQTAAGIYESLTIFGNDYNTHDGTCLRDYIDVVDLAEAHVAALNKLENGIENSGYEVLNLGTGNPSSVLDVIKSFEKVSGEKLNYTIGSRRHGDVEAAYADTSKANDYLNWSAKTSLNSSVLNAWLWEKKIRKIN